MTGSLSGKVALVTGAAVGLGRAFATALARDGARLVVCDVREEIAALPKALETESLALEANVAEAADVQRVAQAYIHPDRFVEVVVTNPKADAP